MTKLFKNQQNDTIRADAAPDESWVEITEDEFAAICESKRVQPDAKSAIQSQIAAIESTVTPRRLREAVLGDGGWLAAKDAEIAALRAQL